MSGLQFIASVVSSLAWPTVVLAVACIFRRQLADLLMRPLSRLKAGPLEATWDRQVTEVKAELPPSAVTGGLTEAAETDRLRVVASTAPAAAVVAGFAGVEQRLRSLVTTAGLKPGRDNAIRLARRAQEAAIIRPETFRAIEGVAVLRNLSAHGHGDVDETRALEYLALVDAVTFALDQDARAARPTQQT